MLRRMFLASKLDVPFYEMVEADPRYTREAFFVVLLVALLSGIGAAATAGASIADLFLVFFVTLLDWVAWAGITLFIGLHLTKGAETQSDMGEMLRVLGYAKSPGVLGVFVFVPVFGIPVVALGALWSLIAGVVAIRQALDFSTGRALLTVVFGWLVVTLLRVVTQMLV